MSEKIRMAIVGHGNLGRSAEQVIGAQPDLELVAVATRRDPATLTPATPGTRVVHVDALADLAGAIDVALACGGSKGDLGVQVPALAERFTVVDTFDTHAKIPEYFDAVDTVARDAGTLALISTGWDPGLFSLNRLMGEAILPDGVTATFWGRGVSQGHSDAIRRVPGVAAGVQYTQPRPEALEHVRNGAEGTLSAGQSHTRHCFVVLADGADPDQVREAIVTMPDYFADYDTTVTFVDADTLARDHAGMPHGGVVIRRATTPDGIDQRIEYTLDLGHNPSFTASVLVAYGRAAHRMAQAGQTGARTVFDVPPGLLSPLDPAELRRTLL